jgi:phospholipid/cholesterol/gamma-HCH transport system ATP-binding protein
MIEVKNLNKSFGDKHVLKDISAGFKKGRPNLIIGASGSGKSVLMKSMVGLLTIDAGEILYEGKDFADSSYDDKKAIRREIGMLFQGGALFDSLTVEQNVMFPLNMFTDMSKEEKLEQVNFCLKRVNLPNSNKLFPSEISGGMKKRVGIARAIALNPKYLFCDEPNSGLDPITSRVIDNLILEITEEYDTTTIINTHDMKTVMDIGDHIVFIYQGQKGWEGSKDEIRKVENKVLEEFVLASVF